MNSDILDPQAALELEDLQAGPSSIANSPKRVSPYGRRRSLSDAELNAPPDYKPPIDSQECEKLFASVLDKSGILHAIRDNQIQCQGLKLMQDESNSTANALVKDLSDAIAHLQNTIVECDQKHLNDTTVLHQRAVEVECNSRDREERVWNEQMIHNRKMQDLQSQLTFLMQSVADHNASTIKEETMEDQSVPRSSSFNPASLGECTRGKGVQRKDNLVNHAQWAADHGVSAETPNVHGDLRNAAVNSDLGRLRPQRVPVGIPPSNAAGGSPKCPILSNSKINPPPGFEPTKFVSWKREYLFWRDIYWYVEDAQLLSVTSLAASPVLKKFLMAYLRDSRDQPNSRSICGFVDALQTQFSAHIREREMTHLDELLAIKRENSELVQNFWFRYDELVIQMDDRSLVLPDNMLFLRLLKGLNVPNHVRLSIITRLDCQGAEHTVKNLRKISIELLGVYKDVLHRQEGGMVVSNATEEETLITGTKKPNKKPGMEERSVRASVSASNFPNALETSTAGKGAYRCFRCGATDHTLRQCPKPFTPLLMFAPKKNGKTEKRKCILGRFYRRGHGSI